MSFKRPAVSIPVTLALAAMAAASIAPNAAAGTQVGQYTGSLPTNSGSNCTVASSCTFFQAQDVGGPSYAAPTDGVITGYVITEGANLAGVNTVQLRAFRPVGVSSWLIAGESPVTPLFVGCCGAVPDTLPARIAVKAGDRIGITVHFDGDTAWQYSTGSGGDVVAQVSGVVPAVGQTLVPLNLFATGSRRINITATLEPDADGDGFGDQTQDLCPGNPLRGDQGCSGDVVGSDFQHPLGGNAGCGGPPCMEGNSALPSGKATARARGVLVRWRMLAQGFAGDYTMRVVRPEGSQVTSVAETTPISVSLSDSGIVTSQPQRIPVMAGDWLGVLSSTGSNYPIYTRAGAGTWSIVNPVPALGVAGVAVNLPSQVEFLQGADVEPDVDGDGYGDETQDACPSDPAFQTACPQPLISGMKAVPSKFRVARTGAAISKRVSKGTTFKFKLSLASDIQYVLSVRKQGRRKGKRGCTKPTAKNRKQKRCTYYSVVTHFKRTTAAGAASLPFSGRYKRSGKPRALVPGRYKLTATPSSSVSHVLGRSKAASFKVLRASR